MNITNNTSMIQMYNNFLFLEKSSFVFDLLYIFFTIIIIFCLYIICQKLLLGPSYGCWIYKYLCNQCLSPLMCGFESRSGRGVPTLCDKVCQWFSLGPAISSINKTDRHYITEILLKVALNTIKQTNKQITLI